MLSKVLSHFSENKLTKEQKHATAVLAVGSFLEYFDLYLYIHMALIMDKIFFPPGSSTNWFLSNLTLCTNFMFRPLGSIILGWLGDNFGRKSTIFVSTTVTAICCAITASLPTYEKIGMMAAYTLTGCRLFQGMLSSAEVQGARIYLMEVTKDLTNQCFLSNLIDCIITVGRFAAIAVASLFINFYNSGNNDAWRNVFWVGCVVALVGTYARSFLKETPEFADAKLKLKKLLVELKEDKRVIEPFLNTKIDIKDVFYLFILKCGQALTLFFAYVYCAKAFSKLGLSNSQCLNYAKYASSYEVLFIFVTASLIFFIHPLKINRFLIYGANVCFITVPIILQYFASPKSIFISQILLLTFWVTDYPASAIMYKRLPVLQRYSSVLMISAISRALIWPVSTFGVSYLTSKIGHCGLYVIFLPVGFLSILAVRHFFTATEKNKVLHSKFISSKNLQNI